MRRVVTAAAGAVLLVLLAGCSDKGTYQIMGQTPRYEPLEGDRETSTTARRDPVPGTVARGQLDELSLLRPALLEGREAAFPFPVTRDVLDRGRQRFDIFCSPCHGRDGYGHGIVVQRGFTSPPSFHTDTLRAYPPGHFVAVMTEGYGAMPQYAKQVSARDRWAIAAYIRALQLSQHAVVADVPADARATLSAPESSR
jgi:mono/diheme cytochrome c family protein